MLKYLNFHSDVAQLLLHRIFLQLYTCFNKSWGRKSEVLETDFWKKKLNLWFRSTCWHAPNVFHFGKIIFICSHTLWQFPSFLLDANKSIEMKSTILKIWTIDVGLFYLIQQQLYYLSHTIVHFFTVVYSGRPKYERSNFGRLHNSYIPKSFGFRTFGLSTGTKLNIRFSDGPLS